MHDSLIIGTPIALALLTLNVGLPVLTVLLAIVLNHRESHALGNRIDALGVRMDAVAVHIDNLGTRLDARIDILTHEIVTLSGRISALVAKSAN